MAETYDHEEERRLRARVANARRRLRRASRAFLNHVDAEVRRRLAAQATNADAAPPLPTPEDRGWGGGGVRREPSHMSCYQADFHAPAVENSGPGRLGSPITEVKGAAQ